MLVPRDTIPVRTTMKPIFISVIFLCVLAACERQSDRGGASGKTPEQPATTRSSSMPRETAGQADATGRLREALLAAEAITAEDERRKATAEVAWQAVEIDQDLAREAFSMLPVDSDERIPLIRHFAMRLAGENPEAAQAWAEQLGSEHETSVALARIALVMAETDPRSAAVLLAESGDSGRELDVAVVQVLQQWTARSPRDAAEWAVLFPGDEIREAGIRTVMSRWLATDPYTAMTWMAAMDQQDVRGEVLKITAEVMARQPENTREAWLEPADEATRQVIERELEALR